MPLELVFVGLDHAGIDQRPFEYEEEVFEVHMVCSGRAVDFFRVCCRSCGCPENSHSRRSDAAAVTDDSFAEWLSTSIYASCRLFSNEMWWFPIRRWCEAGWGGLL